MYQQGRNPRSVLSFLSGRGEEGLVLYHRRNTFSGVITLRIRRLRTIRSRFSRLQAERSCRERERERNRGFSHDHVGMRSPLCQENSQSRFSLRCGYHGANDSYRANLWNSLNSAWLFARGRFLTRPRTMAKWCAQCLFPRDSLYFFPFFFHACFSSVYLFEPAGGIKIRKREKKWILKFRFLKIVSRNN